MYLDAFESMDKNQLVRLSAKLLNELIRATELPWDSVFYRYVEYGEGHISSQWSYIDGDKLKLAEVEDLEEQYLNALENVISRLGSILESQGERRPLVTVLKVSSDGQFSLSFDHDDTKALDISKLTLGTESSYFFNQNVA